MTGVPRVLTIAAAVGAATVAGVFFAFSTFVMPALRDLPDEGGLRAMQSINVAAPASAWFMAILMGTALLCAALGVWAVVRWHDAWALPVLVGALLYLACIVITAAYHVPRNDALGLLDPTAATSQASWRSYAGAWTAWNHVRTVAPLAGSVAFVLALVGG